jgi:hypothetical protein
MFTKYCSLLLVLAVAAVDGAEQILSKVLVVVERVVGRKAFLMLFPVRLLAEPLVLVELLELETIPLQPQQMEAQEALLLLAQQLVAREVMVDLKALELLQQ